LLLVGFKSNVLLNAAIPRTAYINPNNSHHSEAYNNHRSALQ
jgi:hypothetical protein